MRETIQKYRRRRKVEQKPMPEGVRRVPGGYEYTPPNQDWDPLPEPAMDPEVAAVLAAVADALDRIGDALDRLPDEPESVTASDDVTVVWVTG